MSMTIPDDAAELFAAGTSPRLRLTAAAALPRNAAQPAGPERAPTTEIGYTHAATSGQSWLFFGDEENPDLVWPRSVDVYDRMRRQDAQCLSVLRAVTLPVRRTKWSIDPAGARDEVTELVAADLGLPIKGADQKQVPQLRTRDRFSWADHIRQALLMLAYGHMFFEQQYRILPTGPGGKLQARLRKLAPRMPRTISKIDVAPDGGLVSITQHPGQFGVIRDGGAPKPIPVTRLVAYVNEREGGNWLGTSLLRPAYKDWLIKDEVLRTWAQAIRRNGMGVPLYTGPENPVDADVDLARGLELAQQWRSGNAAGASVPYGAKMTLVGVEGDLVDPEKAVRYLDEQIARAVLAHFLNLGTQTGSWALGSTFADFFTLSLQAVGESVQDVANAHVVEDMVDLNFGPDEQAPRIVFEEIGSRHTATAQAIKMLVDAGVIFPDRQLEEFIREAYGVPAKALPTPADGS